MSAARGWQQKQVWPLVESEVRKALAVDTSNLEARHLLFLSLSHQNERAEAIKEAITLSKDLEQSYPEGSRERQALVAFRDSQAHKESWAKLLEAADRKKPEAEALLNKFPESKRDENYWRLAYQIRKHHPDLKVRINTYRQWLKFDPPDAEANLAAKEIQRYDLGLTESPKASFRHLIEADPASRMTLLLGDKGRIKVLNTILKRCRIVEVKEAKENSLTVDVSFVNPYTRKSTREGLFLVYSRARGAYLLDVNLSRFGTAWTLVGDPARQLDSNLSGINGVFDVASIRNSKPLVKAWGPGKREESHLVFDDGRIHASFNNKSQLASVGIQLPSYRTADGLGLGSRLEEFAAKYEVTENTFLNGIIQYAQATDPDASQRPVRLYHASSRQPGGGNVLLGSTMPGVVDSISFRLNRTDTEPEYEFWQKPIRPIRRSTGDTKRPWQK